MGMDVSGKNPTGEKGEYFRANIWWWHPLAEYCQAIAPETCAGCKHWHSNDGDGLDAEQSAELARAIREKIASGEAARIIAERSVRLAKLPDRQCDLCHGSGVRTDNVGVDNGMTTRLITWEGHPRQGQTGWCNACNGVGRVQDIQHAYGMDLKILEEFAGFLEQCGGFAIW